MHSVSRISIVALSALAAAACAGPEVHFESAPRVVEIVHAAGAKLGGVALGDVLPERAGLEIVAVAVDGRVIVVRRQKDHWRSDVAFQAPGELIAVASGDLVPSHPGDEILAVGMASGDEDAGGPGAVWLVTRARGAGFEARLLLEPSALQHAAAIGDFDPQRPGLEALSAGFDERVHLFAIDADLAATHTEIATLPGPAKGACVRGNSALIACASGQVVEVARVADGGFQARVVLERESGFARPAVFGDLLVVAADDGALVAQDLASSAPFEVLHTQGAKARGAFVGDLDVATDGLEAATVGYEGTVWLVHLGVRGADGRPTAVELVATGGALHHLAGGDVLPERPGDELVTVGYSGEVRLLSR
jgi:hypothetical protein